MVLTGREIDVSKACGTFLIYNNASIKNNFFFSKELRIESLKCYKTSESCLCWKKTIFNPIIFVPAYFK